MYRSKTKIWTGVGAVVLSTGSVSASPDQSSTSLLSQHQHEPLTAEYLSADTVSAPLRLASNGGYGGEGGEGGEAGAAAGANPDEAYLTKLRLMQGHLRIGKALVEQSNWDDAVMHFMHPIEEIYSELQSGLQQRNVPAFRAELDTLAQIVRNQQDQQAFTAAYETVQAKLSTARNALDAKVRENPVMQLNVAMRLLQQAAMEYNAAIADGQIVNVAEYQDSRGFVWTAAEMLNSVNTELEQRDPQAWQSMQALLNEVKQAWPDVEPPAQPAQPVSKVLSTISRIDLQASQLR